MGSAADNYNDDRCYGDSHDNDVGGYDNDVGGYDNDVGGYDNDVGGYDDDDNNNGKSDDDRDHRPRNDDPLRRIESVRTFRSRVVPNRGDSLCRMDPTRRSSDAR